LQKVVAALSFTFTFILCLQCVVLVIYWYLYELFKMKIDHSSIFVRSFVSGFTAGTISAVVTLPLDVVKTRRQITLGEMEMTGGL